MLYSRDGIWYVKLSKPDGGVVRHSARTADRKAAQEYHDRLKVKLWEVARLGVKPTYTWDAAALRWLQERDSKASIRDDKQRIRWLTTKWRGKTLQQITRDEAHQTIASLEGVTDRTRDLYVALVRAIMRRAMRVWEWIDTVPAYQTYAPSNVRRVRFITRDQFDNLLTHLPPHQQDIVLFAVSTGLRKANITGLRWPAISLNHKHLTVAGDESKNREPLGIPLNDTAIAVLRKMYAAYQARLEKDPKAHNYVFTYRGKPISEVNTRAWSVALRKAGIEDFRWHDWRHTWASWHRQSGTPTWALQEMGGWKSAEMVRRYAHVATDHLAGFASNVEWKSTQPEKTDTQKDTHPSEEAQSEVGVP
jgi:integrase